MGKEDNREGYASDMDSALAEMHGWDAERMAGAMGVDIMQAEIFLCHCRMERMSDISRRMDIPFELVIGSIKAVRSWTGGSSRP